MDPKDRAELDRLLDIAEKEQLLERAPSPVQEVEHQAALAERQEMLAGIEVEFADVRRTRQALADDAEWLD